MKAIAAAAIGDHDRRRMEDGVRRMLRQARRADALAAMPLVAALGRAFATPDPCAAVRLLVERALPGEGWEARVRHMIADVDLDATATIAQAARRWNVSRRQLQRHRAAAVTALAAYAWETIGRFDGRYPSLEAVEVLARIVATRAAMPAGAAAPPPAPAPATPELVPAEPLYDGRRFALESAAYVGAGRRGSAYERRAIAANLHRLAASSPAEQLYATLCQADAAVASGRALDALRFLDKVDEMLVARPRPTEAAYATVVRAKLALLDGDAGQAERLAFAAYRGVEGDAFLAAEALLTGTRAGLLASRRRPEWSAAPALPERGWHRAAFAVESARAAFYAGNYDQAREAASHAAAVAQGQGFETLAARATATVAMAAFGQGANAGGAAALRASLMALVRNGDVTAAADAYAFGALPGGIPEAAVPAIAAVMAERMTTIVPQMQCDEARQRDAFYAVTATFWAHLLGRASGSGALGVARERLRRTGSAFLQYGHAARGDIEAFATLAAIAMVGPPLADAAARARGTVDCLLAFPGERPSGLFKVG